MSELREKAAQEIASWCAREDDFIGVRYEKWEQLKPIAKEKFLSLADQIHKEYTAWFREEIEKLKPLEPDEIDVLVQQHGWARIAAEALKVLQGYRLVAQVQLDDIKKKLLEKLEGK